MRTHLQVIEAAGGYRALALRLGLKPDRVRFWERRRSIPAEAWGDLARLRIASLSELTSAVSARRPADVDIQDRAA